MNITPSTVYTPTPTGPLTPPPSLEAAEPVGIAPAMPTSTDALQLSSGEATAIQLETLPTVPLSAGEGLAAITATEEFKQLPPAEQESVRQVFEAATTNADGATVAAVTEDLKHLLSSGALTAKDSFGQSALSHLFYFNQLPLTPELSGTKKEALVRDLLGNLARPGSLGQGAGTQDCAEATLEATLAYSQPGDFTRIAVELSINGKATIPGPPQGPNPSTLVLRTDGDPAGRSPLGFIMQRSFEAHVDSLSFAPVQGDDGLNSLQVKMLYDGVLGKNHVTLFANPGIDLVPAIAQGLESGKEAVIKVTMRTEDGQLHAAAITGVSDQGVTLWDPGTAKLTTLSREEFNRDAVRVTLKEETAEASGIKRDKFGGNLSHMLEKERGGRVGARGQRG